MRTAKRLFSICAALVVTCVFSATPAIAQAKLPPPTKQNTGTISVPVTVVNPTVPVTGSVIVTNTSIPITAPSALPVTGSVAVTNTVPVTVGNTVPVNVTNSVPVSGSVFIAGTPSVSLAPGTTVNLNTSNPVAVRTEGHRQPVVLTGSANLVDPNTDMPLSQSGVPFSVPAGKLLIAEHVSAYFFWPSGSPIFYMDLEVNAPYPYTATHFLAVPPPIFFQQNAFGTNSLSQPITLYVPAGGQLSTHVTRDGTSVPPGSAAGAITLTGYLIDCGAGDGCPFPNP